MKKVLVFCTVLMFTAVNFCYAQAEKSASTKSATKSPKVETTDQANHQNPSSDVVKPVTPDVDKPIPTPQEKKNTRNKKQEPTRRNQGGTPAVEPASNVEPAPKVEPAPRPKPQPKPKPGPNKVPASGETR